MKTEFLFLLMIVGFSMSAWAQKFEHFKVDTLENIWILRPTFTSHPKNGVNGMVGDYSGSIIKMIKKAIQTLPEDIKTELKTQDVRINFTFNHKGEIIYINLVITKKDHLFMTDAQWLKVYNTISKLKVDLTKLILLDNFEWGDGGTYPISKYLQETEN